MNFLVDAQLPPALVRWIASQGHQATHVFDIGLQAADDPVIYARALGHQQVNDAWLVEVARRNRGKLITLDTRLPVHADAPGLVEVIKT